MRLPGATGLRPLAGRSIPRTSGQTHRRRSPRACARCARASPSSWLPIVLALARTCRGISPAQGKRLARVSDHPSMVSGHRDAAAPSGILRIASAQFRVVLLRQRPCVQRRRRPLRSGWGDATTTVVWSIGCFPGEWRNGRRAGFRCQCPSGRGGSSPPSPTFLHFCEQRDQRPRTERVRGLCVWRLVAEMPSVAAPRPAAMPRLKVRQLRSPGRTRRSCM